MNMAGLGTVMMKRVMNDRNVNSLETFMQHALDKGIRLVACTMFIYIMGITKEELIDGVEFAGVVTIIQMVILRLMNSHLNKKIGEVLCLFGKRISAQR